MVENEHFSKDVSYRNNTVGGPFTFESSILSFINTIASDTTIENVADFMIGNKIILHRVTIEDDRNYRPIGIAEATELTHSQVIITNNS